MEALAVWSLGVGWGEVMAGSHFLKLSKHQIDKVPHHCTGQVDPSQLQ